MAPNKKQIAIKNAYKSHVTKALTKLGDALVRDEKDEEEITALVESLEIKFKKWETKATELHEEMEDDEEEIMLHEIEDIDKIQEKVTTLKVKAHSILKKKDAKDHKVVEQKTETSEKTPKHRIKLPQVELTEFNGEDDQSEFPAFIDMFSALIDNNKELTDVEKFHYLRKATTRRAGKLMNAYPLCDLNYKIALQRLKDEYGDRRKLISSHFNALLDYKNTCHNWRDLQEFYDFIETKIRCLEVLEAPVDNKNDMIITLIYRQVPEIVQRKISKLENEDKTITNVMKIIKKEVTANQNNDSMLGRDTSHQSVYDDENHNAYYKYGEHNEPKISSASSLPVLANNNRSRSCPYCNKNHSAFNCTEISDVNTKREIVRKTNRCFNCLIPGHQSKDCRSKFNCQVCKERHHTSLCLKTMASSPRASNNNSQHTNPIIASQQGNNNNTQGSASTDRTHYTTGGYHTASNSWRCRGPVILETAIAEMKTSHGKLSVRLFFDKGSQYSYILKAVADKADLPTVGKEILSVNTFARKKSEEIASDLKRVELVKGSFKINLLCNSVETVCVPLQSTSIQEHHHYELQNLQMADPALFSADKLQVDILVGNDYYQEFMSGEVRHTSFGPVVIKSYLGWVLSGPVYNVREAVHKSTHFNFCVVNHVSQRHFKSLQLDEYVLTSCKQEMLEDYHLDSTVNISHLQPVNLQNKFTEDKDLNEEKNRFSSHTLLCETFKSCYDVETEKELDWFWETEHVGILPEELEPTVLDKFEESVRYDEKTKRYIVKWPWKEDLVHNLPENRRMCEKRLDNLLQRLNKPNNETLCRQYQEVISNQLKDGIIEEVPDTETNSYRKHYSPHHPVIKEDKSTTSVRVVYDGSAKPYKEALSLNKCMYAGPSLIKDLVSILMKFRMYPIGIIADIRKAFLQMSLAEEDRDVTRFLWRDNGSPSNPLKIYRFLRVPFGMTASPFLLQATLIHHITKYINKYPNTANKLLESFYVDDLTTGCDSVKEAEKFIFEATLILKEAGMTLTKWRSCNEEVQNYIRSSIENITYHEDEVKILGMNWTLSKDTFSCNIQKLIQDIHSIKPTKRNVLKCIARIFDPMGYIAPYIITAKILMQQISVMKLDWDDLLSAELLAIWEEWIKELKTVHNVKIQRHLFQNSLHRQTEMELIGFADASTHAYAASIYLKYKLNNEVHVKLLISKSRVSPLNKTTIPRLELIAALLLARLMSTVKKFLHNWYFHKTTYHTDSMNVLYWIKGQHKDWSRYVKRRLIEISSLSESKDWYHCPGESNPADLSTRGISAQHLLTSSMYFNGPSELKGKEKFEAIQQLTPPPECFNELKKETKTMTTTTTPCIKNIINIDKYSSFKRLIHITALVIKFVNLLKNEGKTLLQCMTVADTLWIRQEQEKYFSKEVQFITNKENESKKVKKNAAGNLVRQWSLFLDETGILRCRGRFQYADLSYQTKYPILLPKKSHLTTLIIADRHLSLNHAGTKQTLIQIRSEFWIPSGRRLIKDFITRCIPCRRFKAKPYQPPPTGSLPELRLSQLPPFTNTGTDFAGPVFCREMNGKEIFKSYINIFTCASTRAIHLELIPNLTTNCFMNALDRFTSRRGVPHVLVSDNARTFKRAAKELSCFITNSSYQAYLADSRIRWFFYLEKSPWWGGFIERMVGSVKSILRTVLYRALLTFEEMTTILVKIESIINSRPITYTYIDDVVEPLTPSHLLIGKRSTLLPPRTFENTTYIHGGRNEYMEKLTSQFESRWKTEYLMELQDHHITMKKQKGEEMIPKVGDVVIMKEDMKPRNQWNMARVTNVFPGRGDKKIRSIEVQKTNGNLARRPPQLLIPLELPC